MFLDLIAFWFLERTESNILSSVCVSASTFFLSGVTDYYSGTHVLSSLTSFVRFGDLNRYELPMSVRRPPWSLPFYWGMWPYDGPTWSLLTCHSLKQRLRHTQTDMKLIKDVIGNKKIVVFLIFIFFLTYNFFFV